MVDICRTRIVAVRSALIAQLQPVINGAPTMSKVKVSYGWWSRTPQRERVFTRRGRFTVASAGMRAGRKSRDETGRFEVVVLVEGIGQSAEDSTERAVTIGQYVEEFVTDRASNQLGIAGLQTLTITGDGEINEMFNENGTLAELVYPITYTARLI